MVSGEATEIPVRRDWLLAPGIDQPPRNFSRTSLALVFDLREEIVA